MPDAVTSALRATWSRPRSVVLAALAAIAAGGTGFGLALRDPAPDRAWLALGVTLLLFGTTAQGGILCAVLLRLTRSRSLLPWARVAESGLGFVAVTALGLIAVMVNGGSGIWPWLNDPRPELGGWLTRPALATRAAITWGGMALLGAAFVLPGLRRDLGVLGARGHRLTRGWRGAEAEIPALGRQLDRRGVLAAIGSAVGLGLAAFDLVLPLAPDGRNALLGVALFAASLYGGLVLVAIVARLIPGAVLGLDGGTRAYDDLGRLLGVLALLNLYLLAAQLLPIWYGNLRVETGPVLRALAAPWQGMAIFAGAAAYVVPGCALLGCRLARRPLPLALIGLLAAVGLWTECYLVMAVSIRPAPVLGLPEILVAAGGAAALAGIALAYLHAFPLLPVGDPRLGEREGS